MGVNCVSSSIGNTQPPNPNPKRFKIESITKGELFDLIQVIYHGCTTFGGKKILVVSGGSVCMNISELDPHFLESNTIIARFRADDQGIILARYLIENLTGKENEI